MRDAARNKKWWERRHTPTQEPTTDLAALSRSQEEEAWANPLAISPAPPPDVPAHVQQERRRKAEVKKQHFMVATFVGKLVKHGLTTANVTEVFAVFDDDGGGSISEEEFREGLDTLSLLWPVQTRLVSLKSSAFNVTRGLRLRYERVKSSLRARQEERGLR